MELKKLLASMSPWQKIPMKNFLDSEIPDMPAEDGLFHVIPAPYRRPLHMAVARETTEFD